MVERYCHSCGGKFKQYQNYDAEVVCRCVDSKQFNDQKMHDKLDEIIKLLDKLVTGLIRR